MDLFEKILESYGAQKRNVREYPPLVLAYIGDAIYEVYVRTLLVCTKNVPVHQLHKESIKYVKAKAQSDIIHRISGFLTEEEKEIVRRGRNAKSGTIPKNADVIEYKYATGFEALCGYLYLKKDYERLDKIFKMAIDENYIDKQEDFDEVNGIVMQEDTDADIDKNDLHPENLDNGV